MDEYRKDGKTNIDLLMADGDFFVPLVRIDLVERDDKPMPHTWEDVMEIAKFYNGTDLNENGVADNFGFCIDPVRALASTTHGSWSRGTPRR